MKEIRFLIGWILAFVSILAAFTAVSSAGVVDWFQISTDPNNQSRPSLAYNSTSDQFLVVWEDFRAPVGFGSDVYAQLVNSDGSLSGMNFPISEAGEWQRDPKPAYNPVTDQYLVVWEDWRNDSDDIYAQFVKGDGSLVGSEFTISSASNDQSSPDIVYNPSSNQFLIVFDDDRLVQYDYDIYGQIVKADGSSSGPDFPIATSADDQLLPVVAYNDIDHKFLVVWEDQQNPTTEPDIYARLLNADGTMAGPVFSISTSDAEQTTPDVAYNSTDNQFLVVWKHDTEIYGRLVLAEKSFLGAEFLIATSSGILSDPAVGFDDNTDQYLVAWSDNEGWDNIYAQHVASDGTLVDAQFDLATGKGDFFYPDMTFNSSTDQYLLVWQHETCYSFVGCEDNDLDIYGAIYPESVKTEFKSLYLPLVVRD